MARRLRALDPAKRARGTAAPGQEDGAPSGGFPVRGSSPSLALRHARFEGDDSWLIAAPLLAPKNSSQQDYRPRHWLACAGNLSLAARIPLKKKERELQ